MSAKADLKQLSSADIRAMVGRGERTAEGWAELSTRNRRVSAAMRVIERMKANG